LLGFVAQQRSELVPTRLLFEHALELAARRFVVGIEREQLFSAMIAPSTSLSWVSHNAATSRSQPCR
jgi:hypothetical protein